VSTNLAITVAFGVFSILVGVGLPLFVEASKRPSLVIDRAEDFDDDRGGFRIVHVRVVNEPLAGFRSRWLIRNSAEGCHVRVQFRSVIDGTTVEVPSARWSSHPEPLTEVFHEGQSEAVYDVKKVSGLERFDLAASAEGELLGVAIKYRGDNSAYGYSNRSYEPGREGMRNEQLELSDDEYEMVVVAKAGEIESDPLSLTLSNEGDDRAGLELRAQLT
jgi:hypothetical protein